MATFDAGISTGKWIGYQILYGAGRGLGLQMVSFRESLNNSTNL